MQTKGNQIFILKVMQEKIKSATVFLLTFVLFFGAIPIINAYTEEATMLLVSIGADDAPTLAASLPPNVEQRISESSFLSNSALDAHSTAELSLPQAEILPATVEFSEFYTQANSSYIYVDATIHFVWNTPQR
jgi:hypothetical protein